MAGLSSFFLLTGAILLAGLAIDYLGRRTRLPRVTLLLLFGFLIGPSGFELLTAINQQWFPLITDMALMMVGFLLGGQLGRDNLIGHGRMVFSISLVAALMTALTVVIGLMLVGVPADVSMLLAGIATSTAPAATMDVVHEMRAKGLFTRTLLGIVALDDVWGLIIFSLMLTVAATYAGNGFSSVHVLEGVWDVFGAILVGVSLGIPAAYLTGRIRDGEPTLVEAIGLIFLCGGVAILFEVSLLLAVMAMGATVVNLARHHKRPFHAIEHIEWPFMILFFVLAGASLHLEALEKIGYVGVLFVALRAAGKMTGSWLGAVIGMSPPTIRNWTGIALMPQAGVALGMALIASQRFPESGEMILTIVIGAVVIFELIGPVMTRIALLRCGEAREQAQGR